jgi:hypothetical protein
MTGSAFFFHATKIMTGSGQLQTLRTGQLQTLQTGQLQTLQTGQLQTLQTGIKKQTNNFFLQTVFLLQAGMSGMSRLEWLE